MSLLLWALSVMSDTSDAGDSSAGERRPEDSPSDSDDPDFLLLEAALAAGHEARCHTLVRQDSLV